MEFENLSSEQMEKARACKSTEDVFALAKEEGYELSDEELDAVSGGDWDCWSVCTKYVKETDCSTQGYGSGPW